MIIFHDFLSNNELHVPRRLPVSLLCLSFSFLKFVFPFCVGPFLSFLLCISDLFLERMRLVSFIFVFACIHFHICVIYVVRVCSYSFTYSFVKYSFTQDIQPHSQPEIILLILLHYLCHVTIDRCFLFSLTEDYMYLLMTFLSFFQSFVQFVDVDCEIVALSFIPS